MSADRRPGRLLERVVAPRALLAGAAAAFLACSATGWFTACRNHLHHFERFHLFLSVESLFYPTVSQVRALARERLDPDRIVVVVGGGSRLHGTGQPAGEVWTKKLQALLGDDYQVLNLGVRSGQTAEFGAIAAEVLARDYPKLILVSDLNPPDLFPDPDGWILKYFFWDAYYKGLLLPHPERDARLRSQVAEREFPTREGQKTSPKGERQGELRAEMELDSILRFTDLWNTAAYDRLVSVWTPLTGAAFTRPRRHYADPEPGPPPVEDRYRSGDDKDKVAMMRATLSQKCCLKDDQQHWIENPTCYLWSTLERTATESFPEIVRRRTLLLAVWFSAHHLQQLSADEQACYAAMSRATVHHLEAVGFPALEIGPGYAPADYTDFRHLAPSGGDKMAAAVAGKVRALAACLGYTEGGPQP